MNCRYCNHDVFDVHEFTGVIQVCECKGCHRFTINTLDGGRKQYAEYSSCTVRGVRVTDIARWMNWSGLHFLYYENKSNPEKSLLEPYPAYIGSYMNDEVVGGTAVMGALGLREDPKRLEAYFDHNMEEVKRRILRHDNFILRKIWYMVFAKQPVPEYKRHIIQRGIVVKGVTT